jgi:hypothetical protein
MRYARFHKSSVRARCFRIAGLASIVIVFAAFGIIIPNSPTASAVAKGDGLVVYGASGNTTPRVRTYAASSNTFGSEGGTVAGAVPAAMMLRTSPLKHEVISGYVDAATGTLRIMCYNGTSWTNEWNVGVGGTGTTRRFDISYESNSGDVVVLYSTNTTTTNELAYRTKSGSTGCGSANWSSATNLTAARTDGTVLWVKMGWDRRSSSDLITAIWADDANDLSANVWSGSGWVNEPSAALSVNLENATSSQDVDDFDVEYESVSGDVMVVWAAFGGGATNLIRFVTCTGGTSGCTWSSNACPGVACIPTVADAATNMDIAANPVTDEIAMGAMDDGNGDVSAGYWSGSAWTGTATAELTGENPNPGTRNVAVGWTINGATTRSVIAYNDSGATNIGFFVGNGATFTQQTDQAPTPAFAAPQKVYDIQMDPYNMDRLMLTVSDTASDLFAKRLVMSSSGVFTWSDSNAGAVLTATLGQATVGDFSFAYWRMPPIFEQASYRWYSNADNVQPGSSLTGSENTPASIDASIVVRLRMALGVTGLDLDAATQGFRLESATSTSGPWSAVGEADPWCSDATGITCDTAWLNRRKVTFDNSAAPTTDLTDFAVLIKLTATGGSPNIDYSKTKNSGEDLRFVDPSNPSLVLPHEIEEWNESGTSQFG